MDYLFFNVKAASYLLVLVDLPELARLFHSSVVEVALWGLRPLILHLCVGYDLNTLLKSLLHFDIYIVNPKSNLLTLGIYHFGAHIPREFVFVDSVHKRLLLDSLDCFDHLNFLLHLRFRGEHNLSHDLHPLYFLA